MPYLAAYPERQLLLHLLGRAFGQEDEIEGGLAMRRQGEVQNGCRRFHPIKVKLLEVRLKITAE